MPTLGWSLILGFFACGLALLGLLRLRGGLPMDLPNERSLHVQPVPRIGGLGIVAGVLAAMAWLRPAGLGWVLAMALCLALVSWLDDLRGLSVRARLSTHVLAAGVFLAWGGEIGRMEWLLGVLVMVWMTNLYNFMDGSDGLAGGMGLFGFSAYGLAALMGGGLEIAALSMAVVGASVAFLGFNFPPARLFMGDSGSIPLGFLAGGLGWMGANDGLWSPLFPVLVFSPFIVDASMTMLARLRRGERVWQAHRGHYYQRLVRMGWSHRRVVLLEYALMAATASSGLAWVMWPGLAWGLGLAWGIVYMVLMAMIDRQWRRMANAH